MRSSTLADQATARHARAFPFASIPSNRQADRPCSESPGLATCLAKEMLQRRPYIFLDLVRPLHFRLWARPTSGGRVGVGPGPRLEAGPQCRSSLSKTVRFPRTDIAWGLNPHLPFPQPSCRPPAQPPLGRTPREPSNDTDLALSSAVFVLVGLNFRFHGSAGVVCGPCSVCFGTPQPQPKHVVLGVPQRDGLRAAAAAAAQPAPGPAQPYQEPIPRVVRGDGVQARHALCLGPVDALFDPLLPRQPAAKPVGRAGRGGACDPGRSRCKPTVAATRQHAATRQCSPRAPTLPRGATRA